MKSEILKMKSSEVKVSVRKNRFVEHLVEKGQQEKRVKVCTTLKVETVQKLQELAKEANVTLATVLGELIDIGFSFGDTLNAMSDRYAKELAGVAVRLKSNQVKPKPKKAVKKKG